MQEKEMNFIIETIGKICDHAVEIGEDPNDVLRHVAEIILMSLEVSTFSEWDSEEG